jgi:hypothetical protein
MAFSTFRHCGDHENKGVGDRRKLSRERCGLGQIVDRRRLHPPEILIVPSQFRRESTLVSYCHRVQSLSIIQINQNTLFYIQNV